MTLPILASLLTGPLARYATTLLPPEAACDAIPGLRLLQPVVLEDALAHFGRRYAAPPDRRACASLWFKHHVAPWLVPGLAANLLLDLDLPLALREVDVVLSTERQTVALRLPGPGRGVDAADRFATLREHHLAPLIGTLAAVGGIAPRVLWSNAGNVFENVVRQVETLAPAAPGLTAAQSFLDSRLLPGGGDNPLYRPVRYLGADARRERRVCCLRYLIKELDYCSTCPLPAAKR
jgi:ferric iron reductase protein FhuF